MFWPLLVADRLIRHRRAADHSRYRLLRVGEDEVRVIQIERTWEDRKKQIIKTIMIAAALALATVLAFSVLPVLANHRDAKPLHTGTQTGTYPMVPTNECDNPEQGFTCSPDISHSWGQYSPYFSLSSSSKISPDIPAGCQITFAQVLSRHGARDPTSGKSLAYRLLIEEIQQTVTSYGPGYEFLRDYTYDLGSDQLTPFGEQEMINSGIKFYTRYRDLASRAENNPPFIRSGGQQRVVESAEMFMQGYHSTLESDKGNKNHGGGKKIPPFPYPILTIPEDKTTNNTLSHGLCDAFESPNSYYSSIGSKAQQIYAATFTPPIISRLNANLRGYKFTTSEVISLMDLCPFTSVAPPYQPHSSSSSKTLSKPNNDPLSPFCSLFTNPEWKKYDYYQTLGKWYSYGPGNPLGPTQGVGYVNELISRMTREKINDHTSTNSTLDNDPVTFPLDKVLYADFSHDNDMVSILGALGVYGYGNGDGGLSNVTRMGEDQTGGFSARWTVPFGGRVYFEKMRCQSSTTTGGGVMNGGKKDGEYVRILVNDRVVPLRGCDVDKLGRCTLDRWVESLEFARRGGEWDTCFAK